MRRILFPVIPLFVAGAVVVLASPVLRAQQQHDHSSTATAGQACACCGKSGGEAMNHAAGGGCCDHMATNQAAAPAGDHSAMNHEPAQKAAKPGGMAMGQGAGGGCCGNMAMSQGAAKPDAKAMGQGAGCCADMKMDHGAAATSDAKPMGQSAGGGCCGNMAMGKGEGSTMPMAGADPSQMADMQVFHFLLENRAEIRRTVTVLANGIDTVTESDNPEIAAKLKTHVSAMYGRLKDGRAIHQHDPLFAELFEHADQIDANITYTDKGLHVVETSTDPAVAHLLHRHAETVDAFIKNGMAEMMKEHQIN